ncbi:hypothetical protein [Halalkalicoccus tibetensis]|uniref:Uncharacterized protein n=1 Tax=Halalkalicoccus tibetensis TaxID=175632 RepID=A0ABD5V2V9_9EURY
MIATGTALPLDTTIALVLVTVGPVLAVLLYLVDRRRGDGEVSVAGRR